MSEDEMLGLVRDLYVMLSSRNRDERKVQRARKILLEKNVKLFDEYDQAGFADCVVREPQYSIPSKILSPVQLKARHLSASLFKKEAKLDPSLTVVRHHMRVDEYNAYLMGGKHCSRLTIPIVNLDQIKAAANALKKLSEELSNVADDESAVVYKVLAARCIINTYSRRLKGGAEYKGAR